MKKDHVSTFVCFSRSQVDTAVLHILPAKSAHHPEVEIFPPALSTLPKAIINNAIFVLQRLPNLSGEGGGGVSGVRWGSGPNKKYELIKALKQKISSVQETSLQWCKNRHLHMGH